MKSARNFRRFWIFSSWLIAIVAPGAQAQETKSEATKPTSAATSAAKPAPAGAEDARDNDEFLEFLGSLDAEASDDDWLDYLAQTDIRKVAKAKKKARAPAESQPASDKAGK